MDWKTWKGKRVFVRLKTGDCYTGSVLDIDDTYGMITIEDKYKAKVVISLHDISKIAEDNK